jgi:hypothetical protein
MTVRKRDELVPYGLLEPGFEAVYVDEVSIPESVLREFGTLATDREGRAYVKYSAWGFAHTAPDKWNDEIRHINSLQAALGPLGDDTRRVRQHIAGLQCCDSGVPVTIDEALSAIGSGALPANPFHAGCWMSAARRTTQPGDAEAMKLIEEVLRGFLAGRASDEFVAAHPHARGFIERTYDWLGDPAGLTQIQRLMLERVLLPFEFFTKRNPDHATVNRDCFEPGGRGEKLDDEISRLAGLPKVYPNWRDEFDQALAGISDPPKKELYNICGRLAHGLHGMSDCHHSTFRWLERWIHAIGTLSWEVPGREKNREGTRLGQLLFGYALGLDRWLQRVPHQFLLLDLGYVDLGFNPANEVKRVYACLGEERTNAKEWLAACLWYKVTLEPPASLYKWGWRHKALLAKAAEKGISVREWMDSALSKVTSPVESAG